MNDPFFVDDLRFLSNTNTQMRCLRIASQITKTIGVKQIPKSFLKHNVYTWSARFEEESELYSKHNGKLTEKGNPTVAFNRYLDFMESLGLISYFGDIYYNTRLGLLLNSFIKKSDDYVFELSKKEKMFYLYVLFFNDADIIILALSIVIDDKAKNQSDILNVFKKSILDRLTTKQRFATIRANKEISKKYITIQYNWKEPDSYAEHIIVPRLEWLSDLGLVKLTYIAGRTKYYITVAGKKLYNSFIELPNSKIKDINDKWINTSAALGFSRLISNRSNMKSWQMLNKATQQLIVGSYLNRLFSEVVNNSNRIGLHTALLFLIIMINLEVNTITEIENIISILKEKVLINDKIYSVRIAARLNEGYIEMKYAKK